MSRGVRSALVWAAILGVALAVYVSGHNFYRHARRQRAAVADEPGAPIGVAVVWPREPNGKGGAMSPLERGVRLAAAEINAGGGVRIPTTAGKVDRRRLRIVHFEEVPLTGALQRRSEIRSIWKEPWQNRRLRQRIAHDYGIQAIIGYAYAPSAVRASVTYDYNGVLFIAPALSSPALTAHGFERVFRSVPSDRELAMALARAALEEGWTRVGVVFARSDLGTSLERTLEQTLAGMRVVCGGAVARAGTVAFRISYALDEDDFRPLFAQLHERRFDCLVVADHLPRAAVLIRQLRAAGFEQPVLGTIGIDSPRLWRQAGAAAEGVTVASAFALAASGEGTMASHLVAAHRARFGSPPDFQTAQGYEALRLLAQAIERGGSAVPSRVAATLRHGGRFQGLWGRVGFDRYGAVAGKRIFLKEVHGGAFRLRRPPLLPPGCTVVADHFGGAS